MHVHVYRIICEENNNMTCIYIDTSAVLNKKMMRSSFQSINIAHSIVLLLAITQSLGGYRMHVTGR